MLKKLFGIVLIAIMSVLMSGCIATDAVVATETTDVVYMDTGNRYVVVYINGIPNYRFYDPHYSRYYYRPVPRHRYHYIGRPVRVTPPRNPRYYDTRPRNNYHGTNRNHYPDRMTPQPRPDHRMGRITQPHSRGTIGGRR